MENRITGTTGLLALIGSPVGHSGSPAMYNYSFQRLGLDYAYVAFDIQESEVEKAIEAIRTFKMRGCNVTMPDKTACRSRAKRLRWQAAEERRQPFRYSAHWTAPERFRSLTSKTPFLHVRWKLPKRSENRNQTVS